ncbi:MAG: glycerol-3-phosphate dehydrogenase [Notoacmeibacter sp.]|nr:glycerol-3-phosphate dehydrogenase [Notoacmeibacter sp.]
MSTSTSINGGQAHFDILVIGGGINGAGIARDAAGRGYSVCLCDAGDFGSGTSSASTKLVHGGLRYLEFYEFRLVREALMEREVLWKMAPHIIWPLRFVLPYHKGLRPAWMLRIGLFLYDHLGGRRLLPGTRTLDLTRDPAGKPLKPLFRKGFEYSDCWVEDTRMVILNLRDAEARGARILARTAASRAVHEGGKWHVTLDGEAGIQEITASVVVNAAGPWVDQVLRAVFSHNDAHNVRLVGGSHIVIRRKFDHDRPYIFQNADQRVIFAIPYERDFTLIGTTDTEHDTMPVHPEITPGEVDYLCAMASEYFAEPVTRDDVVWTYSGVRPLFDDGASRAQEATRDYVIRRDHKLGGGTVVNIFGGKITTYRKLAEAMLAEVEDMLGKRKPAWTRGTRLPGGDFEPTGYDALVAGMAERYPFAGTQLLERLVRLYGTETATLLGDAKSIADLGPDFGAGLHEAEIRYLMKYEWAMEADDVLYRRTRLGIRMTAGQIEAVDRWMKDRARASRATDSGQGG